MKIYTIGASRRSAEAFFQTLQEAGVEKILDLRLNNASQLLGFSKGKDLKYFCERCHRIDYEHLPALAPTKELLKRYKQDKDWGAYESDFAAILESRPVVDSFRKAAGGRERLCLLCSESSPEKCHRRLVAEYIAQQVGGVEIIHL